MVALLAHSAQHSQHEDGRSGADSALVLHLGRVKASRFKFVGQRVVVDFQQMVEPVIFQRSHLHVPLQIGIVNGCIDNAGGAPGLLGFGLPRGLVLR
ncbi:hypothetical protein SANTM175S_11039 [Streptomyces antimycoticus]